MTPLYYMAFRHDGPLSRLIRFCTRSDYSHIAICTDVASMTLIEPWAHNGGVRQWWDYSDLRAHTPGTRFEIWELPVTPDLHRYAMDFYHLLAVNRRRYDWRGVIGFEVQFIKQHSRGFFCSEGAIWPISHFCKYDRIKPERVSPADFVGLIQAMGGKCLMTGRAGETM
jgi:hypothetical protein